MQIIYQICRYLKYLQIFLQYLQIICNADISAYRIGRLSVSADMPKKPCQSYSTAATMTTILVGTKKCSKQHLWLTKLTCVVTSGGEGPFSMHRLQLMVVAEKAGQSLLPWPPSPCFSSRVFYSGIEEFIFF